MTFADDLMARAKAIEDEAVGELCAKWNSQHPVYTPGLYNDPVATRQYFGITEVFQPFSLLPDPAAFQPVIDSLKQAMGLLRVDAQFSDPIDPSDQFGVARPEYHALLSGEAIDNWTGATAQNFRDKFMSHFQDNTENTAIMVSVLKAALEAHSSIWANARSDIMSIADKMIAAMQVNTGSGCDQNAWVMVFSVLAGIASIAAVPLSGGASLEAVPGEAASLEKTMAVTAIGATSSMATNAIPDITSGDQATYNADNLETGIAAMKSAIFDLQTRIDSGLQSITVSLVDNLSFVNAQKQELFTMAKPSLSTNDLNLIAGR
ncbi:MAG TPA: hypothetical protein VJ914_06050 [Pseudonocardiaceae bacterium]|nr:hypothetical protein [Pseudonocardiaceae bacterium]